MGTVRIYIRRGTNSAAFGLTKVSKENAWRNSVGAVTVPPGYIALRGGTLGERLDHKIDNCLQPGLLANPCCTGWVC